MSTPKSTSNEDFNQIKAPQQPIKAPQQSNKDNADDVSKLTVSDDGKPSGKIKLNADDLTDAIVKRHYMDTALREKYSFKAFKVVKKSLWGWAILLFIYGVVKLLTKHENGGFEIFSDNVLIAITTATTLNIYAGFLSLIRGLFPSFKGNTESDTKKFNI